jgi:putative membrane protein
MRKTLTENDRSQLEGLIAQTEKRTKTQIVLSVIQRSDSYIELPWKAFALGVSLAGLLVLILNLPFYDWYPPVTALTSVAGTLVGGTVFALLTVLIPSFAKRFLADERAEVEVKQYAQSQFLDRELFATSSRTGILLMLSLFERKVVILPDKGLDNHLSLEAMQRIIASMTPFLKRKQINRAFTIGLEELSQVLGTAVKGSGKDELPDEIIEEKGV